MKQSEQAVEKTYYLGVSSGMISASEAMLAVIDKALEEGIESPKVIEMLRILGEHCVEQNKIKYDHLVKEIKKCQ